MECVTLREPRCKSLYRFLENKESEVWKYQIMLFSLEAHLFIVNNMFSVAKQVCAMSKQIFREERDSTLISPVLSERYKELFQSLFLVKSKSTEVIHCIRNDVLFEPVYDGGPYHIEISPLICRTNQWTGFYLIGISVMKELNRRCRSRWKKY